eukprot:988216_1
MSDNNEDWDRSVDDHDYVGLAYCYLTLVIVGFITTVFVRKLCMKWNDTQETDATDDEDAVNRNKVITRASIAVIFLYLLSATLLSIEITKVIVIDREHGIALNRVLHNIASMPYACNLTGVLPFVLLQRLNHFSRSKCVHVVSYVWLCCGILFIPLIMATTVNASYSVQTMVRTIFMSGWLIISTLLYFVVALVYLRVISKVMKSRMQANMSIKYTDPDDAPVVIVTFQTVKDVIRCSLLVMICSVSNLLTPISSVLGQKTARHVMHQSTYGNFGPMSDMMCNTVCVFLLFRFSEAYYFKMCGSCHDCAFHCCLKKVSKPFKLVNPELTDKDYESLMVEDATRD